MLSPKTSAESSQAARRHPTLPVKFNIYWSNAWAKIKLQVLSLIPHNLFEQFLPLVKEKNNRYIWKFLWICFLVLTYPTKGRIPIEAFPYYRCNLFSHLRLLPLTYALQYVINQYLLWLIWMKLSNRLKVQHGTDLVPKVHVYSWTTLSFDSLTEGKLIFVHTWRKISST